MEQEKIGKLIAKLRKEKGYTQEQFGEILSVTGKTISKWETGRTLPDILLLKDIANILEITVTELLTGEVFQKSSINAVDNINTVTVKTINNYINVYKKRLGLIIGVVSIIILCGFGSYLYFDNYHNYKFYILSSVNENFSVNGFLTQNTENTILTINSLNYLDTLRGTDQEIKTSEVKIDVYSDDKFITSSEKTLDEEVYLGEILSDFSIYIYNKDGDEEKVYINPKNIYLIINYKINNEGKKISIPLKY